MTLYQEHNNQEAYAYVMYPNATNAVFKEKLRESEVIVLQNDGSVQSIYDGTINSWGVVLYEDQSFSVDDYFTVNKKGVYSIKKEKNHYVVSYYNPVEETYVKDTIESPHGHEVVKEASEADKDTVIQITIEQEKDDHPSHRNNRHNGDHKDNNSGHNGNRSGNNSGHNGNNGHNGNKGNNGKGNRP